MSATVRKSSDIVAARELLLEVADLLDRAGERAFANFLRLIVTHFMKRGNSDVQRAPITRSSLTPTLASAIRNFKKAHPNMNQDEIGRHFNVAGGRVSEALAGHNWSPGKLPRK